MTFDSDAPQSKRFSFYGVDDAKVGENVMGELASRIGGKGKIAILAGSASAPNLKRRTEGARAAAAKHPRLEVVEVVNHAETPREAAAAVLRVNAAHPDLAGWAMVGGWPLFRSSQTPDLIADLQKRKLEIVAVDALPDQLFYVGKGMVPVLWAQPTFLWGDLGVRTIFDKLVLSKPMPERIPMELIRVSATNLGTWARQLRSWGFSGVSEDYLKLP